MENTNATACLFLDNRRSKKDLSYPLKLTIYFEGQKRRYSTGVSLSLSEWQKLNGPNLRDDQLRLIKRSLQAKKEKAEHLLEQIVPFSFDEFEERFFQVKKDRKSSSLADLFVEYMQKLNAEGRVSSAIMYKTTLNSLLEYKKGLKISDVTGAFLEAFEKHLLSKHLGKKETKAMSPTTVGIYMRHLRAIINLAIVKGLLSADKYPFKGYSIPCSRNIKKALSAEHLKKLLLYRSDLPEVQRAVDFWVFSYISNGINFTDICNLRPEDIQGSFFSFYRAKTKNTKKKDRRPIKVPLTPETKAIISRWHSQDTRNPYLFPILSPGLTPRQQKYKIQDFIAKVNKQMNLVATEIGFEGKIGTYVARHSHSTILKRQGVSTEFIKENLGHSSVLTTENYLGDFEDEVKQEYATLLTNL